MRTIFRKLSLLGLIVLGNGFISTLSAQISERVEMLPYGDMNQWLTREVKESGIIGGKTKQLYEIAPNGKVVSNEPYVNQGGSPWAVSNVMARVAGITKTNTCVYPAKHNGGHCIHMVTHMESVKVLGLVDITVLAAGSVFLGTVVEPIKGTKNPQSYLNSGIVFTQLPKAIRFDYKIKLSGKSDRIRVTGFSPVSEVKGKDTPAVVLLLQKRWEDEKGGLHAKRIGTMIVHYDKDSDWKKDATYEIIYGDASKSPSYKDFMAIQFEERYALNSKNENVPIIEEGWAEANETPTHMVLQFVSSHGGAYIGSPGNEMWIDNIRLVYQE